MAVDNLFAWIILGGLLVLLILEAMVAVAPYVRQSAEMGLIEAARRAKDTVTRNAPVGTSAGDGDDDQEDTAPRNGKEPGERTRR